MQALSIRGVFDVQNNHTVCAWLKQQKLFNTNFQCIIEYCARLSSHNKMQTQCTVAQQNITRKQLKVLGDLLLESIGQHSHYRLSDVKNHLPILDSYCQHDDELHALATLRQQWNKVLQEIESLRQQQQKNESHLDLLRYHIEELNALTPETGEYEEIDMQHKRISHIGQTSEHIQDIYKALYQGEENDIYSQIAHMVGRLSGAAQNDPQIAQISEQLETILQSIQEISANMQDFLQHSTMDAEEFSALEQRLSDYVKLARKHHIAADKLAEHHAMLLQQLEHIENPTDQLARLNQHAEDLAKQYATQAKKVSQQRHQKAEQLMDEMTPILHHLNMPETNFFIVVSSDIQPQVSGTDHVEFMLQTNPKRPPLPLAKIASGGELSRVNLALHAKALTRQATPTIIFDEVDVGIGGKTAETVGILLKELSDKVQVICITHLPQIAKFAQTHLAVTKSSNHSAMKVNKLTGNERDREIARMLAGQKITERTLAHAHEILSDTNANKY